MIMKPVRVLVVDDSPTMRSILTSILAQDPDIDVVGAAVDAYEARDAIKRLSPDVITLDVEMPRMDGISFLERLMRLRPMPVVMVSSLTSKGARAAIEALMLGAVECVGKPTGSDPFQAFADLPRIVKTVAGANVGARARQTPAAGVESVAAPTDKIALFGASTGGVDALMSILQHFPKSCPPTIVVQHMPEAFTPTFAARLDHHCSPKVVQAEHNAVLEQGHVYIAPGGRAHLVISGRTQLRCALVDAPPENGHSPSVDVLFRSTTPVAKRVVATVLTGLGKDGAKGLKQLRDGGATTICQDQATSVVYGMPKAAVALNAAQRQLRLNEIAQAVLSECARSGQRA